MDDVFRMARRLASMGMPVEDVSKATGMAPDEVPALWNPTPVAAIRNNSVDGGLSKSRLRVLSTRCQIPFRRVSSSARRHLGGIESTDHNGTKSTASLSRLSWETTNAFFGE